GRAPPDEAQEDPAAAPALVRDPYPLIHVGIAGQPRTRVHRKEHLVTAPRPLAHVAVRRRLELHGHGERHFARAQRRPALAPQAALPGPGDTLGLVREVQRSAVVLLGELGARLLQQRGGLRQVARRLRRRRSRPGRGAGGLRRDVGGLRRARRERRCHESERGNPHGPKKGPRRRALRRRETAPRGHPAASCESACCCIGSCAWALTHTPGWGIVTTNPSVTRSGFAWYAARAARHSAGSCAAERSGKAIALPMRPT